MIKMGPGRIKIPGAISNNNNYSNYSGLWISIDALLMRDSV